jgi:transposase
MDETTLRQQLRESEARNEELRRELASRDRELRGLRAQYEALRLELPALQADQQGLQQDLPSRRECQGQATEELAALRHDYQSLAEATQVITRERDALRERVAELEAAQKRLVEMLWGRRSERRTESPDQLQLNFPDEPIEPPSPEEQEVISAQRKADEALDQEQLRRLEARRKARQQRQHGRQEFPPHLERRVRVIDLPEEEKEGLKLLRIDITEKMRFEKPVIYIEQIQRYEYVVPGRPEQGVKSAPAPLSIIERCKYDFSVIAAMISMKYAFHLPTYRQQDWFAQCGWFPSRSTANDLINYGVDTIDPLYGQMWSLLLEQPILLGDDTTVRVLLRDSLSEEQVAQLAQRSQFREAWEPGQPPPTGPPGSATSYAWLYTGLDGSAPYNIFHWSLTHQNAVIDTHLATYRGVFVGDACGANARLQQRSEGRITHASCNAHARREFIEAESNAPILASQARSFYRQLYDVEERAKTLDAEARWALRQRDAVPIWRRFGRWLDSDPLKRVLPKSDIGKALGYLRNQWSALQVYLSDGRLPIDNDQSEQILRPLTVGRGNWLFLGHPQAAPGRLKLYSIVSSAHRHHLVIHDYLEDVLTRLADARQNHPADLALGSPYLLDLLPDRWALAHPRSVRRERVEERQFVFDGKRARRARQRVAARAKQTAGAP